MHHRLSYLRFFIDSLTFPFGIGLTDFQNVLMCYKCCCLHPKLYIVFTRVFSSSDRFCSLSSSYPRLTLCSEFHSYTYHIYYHITGCQCFVVVMTTPCYRIQILLGWYRVFEEMFNFLLNYLCKSASAFSNVL